VRLDILERGHGRRNALALTVMRTLGRAEPDDVVKTSLYRPELFGRPWIALLRETMRGPSPWTPGERELLGAFTSRLNECPYCADIHAGTASLALATPVDSEGLGRWRDGGFGPRITAAFALLEGVNAATDLPVKHVRAAREAGLTEDEIRDALHVQFVFNVVNRLANALGYGWAAEADRVTGIRVLHRIGYRLPGFLLR
jgi:AhpD family alkylhydroperoxidase